MAGKSKKLGVIGCGNMGAAILSEALKKNVFKPSNVLIYDKMTVKTGQFCRKTRCVAARDAGEVAQKSDIILLAVKPQDFLATAAEIRSFLRPQKTVISILAGVPLKKLQVQLSPAEVVRAMPNLGAQVGASITAICSRKKSSLKFAADLFGACGSVITLNEKHFDTVTAVSGSGPAYFFFMMELLQAFAEQSGIDAKSARALAVQTAVGASQLAAVSVDQPAVLRERVTSKKGTTDAALSVLKYRKFPKTFFEALRAAVRRGRQLSGSK